MMIIIIIIRANLENIFDINLQNLSKISLGKNRFWKKYLWTKQNMEEIFNEKYRPRKKLL